MEFEVAPATPACRYQRRLRAAWRGSICSAPAAAAGLLLGLLLTAVGPGRAFASQAAQETQPATQTRVARNALEATALPSDWQGAAGVRIVVTDEGGDPLPEVDVLLRLEAQSDAGTLLLRSDAQGQAAARGLAAGEWQVDLRREGFMLLTAYLRLEEGKDPKVGFSSRQRTGTFWAPLSAVFLPVDLPISAAVKTGRDSPKEARKAQRQATKAARAEEQRRAKLQQRGTLARVVEDADAAAQAAAREEQRQQEREAKEAERAAARAREAAARANAVAEREERRREAERRRGRLATVVEEEEAPEEAELAQVAGRAESVESAESVDVVPAASAASPEPPPEGEAPAPLPGAEPARLLPNPRLLPAGACPECRPGELSVSTESVVAAASDDDPACSRSLAAALPPLARLIAANLDTSQRAFAGSLIEEDGNDVLRLLPEQARQQVAPVARSLRQEARSCAGLAVILPAGAQYIGFRYQAGERGVLSECLLGQECQVGQARWVESPIVTTTDSVTLVHAVFENRSSRRSRLARLVVYFRPGPGWLPPN